MSRASFMSTSKKVLVAKLSLNSQFNYCTLLLMNNSTTLIDKKDTWEVNVGGRHKDKDITSLRYRQNGEYTHKNFANTCYWDI